MTHPPHLRLVGLTVTDEVAQWQNRQQMKLNVTKENRLSAHGQLTPDDPALRLAAHVRGQLQGPVLSPQRRERILKLANNLGVRPFQASLVIAIEQDRARHAYKSVAVQPPSTECIAARTEHITEHIAHEAPIMAARWLLAAASAVLLAALLIRFIL